jgi:hypothetical protein
MPVTVLPATVQKAGVEELKLTARPEVAVALAVVVPLTARVVGLKVTVPMDWSALLIAKLPADTLDVALKPPFAAQSTSMAYDAALVGAVPEPLYLILLTAPPPEQVTIAAWADPLYVTGELFTVAVCVEALISKLPAARLVPAA